MLPGLATEMARVLLVARMSAPRRPPIGLGILIQAPSHADRRTVEAAGHCGNGREFFVAMATKVWFITGTSKGFGRIWAEAALARGDRVAATARDVATLQPLVERFGDAIAP